MLPPLACSFSPSPDRLAQDDEGEEEDVGVGEEEGGDEGASSGEEEGEDLPVDEDGSSSNSSYSLSSLLHGTLLPEVFANLHADGSLPHATYTRHEHAYKEGH